MHLASLAKVRADRDATIPLEEDLAMASNGSRYYVGGLLLPRPFQRVRGEVMGRGNITRRGKNSRRLKFDVGANASG